MPDCTHACYIRSHIIIPSTIWGFLTGPLADAGIAHIHSHQIPWAITAGLKRGQGGMVGKGLNVWPHVELHEGRPAVLTVIAIVAEHDMQWLIGT